MDTSSSITGFFASRLGTNYLRAMSLTNVTHLTGPETYELWAMIMTAVFKGQGLYEIVIDGKKPEKDASPEEKGAYSQLSSIAVNIYIQVVGSKILGKILKLKDPHLMWKYLKELYYQNNTFILIHQLRTVALLANAYDPGRKVISVIDEFETEYDRLTSLAQESSNSSCHKLAEFLDDDEVKSTYLLSLFCEHHKDVVDNLTIKKNCTYAVIKQNLLRLNRTATPPTTDIAQVGKAVKNSLMSKKPGRVFKPSKRPSLNECSFCKKHFWAEHKGHVYNSCPRLKERLSQPNTTQPETTSKQAGMIVMGIDQNDSNKSRFAPVM